MELLNDNLRSWAADLDPGAQRQAEATSRLPILAGPVALMPDAHLGIGATVGSVVATQGAIIPAAVGVDLGCGMCALELDLTTSDLPDDLRPLLSLIEQYIPAGLGRGHGETTKAAEKWVAANPPASDLDAKVRGRSLHQLGTLGSGNHFVELCTDEREVVWLMLHSGSRGVGQVLAQGHIRLARDLAKAAHLGLEDPDLAWFAANTPEFQAYMADLMWAQDYARENREIMLTVAHSMVDRAMGRSVRTRRRINCHHNYVAIEQVDGRPAYVTRKGAIRAGAGELGIIPGSMGTGSFIVEGLGNPLSYESCSHGAGRRLSRSAAKREYTTADLTLAMKGKTWLSDRGGQLVDEIPMAYKSIEDVMTAQADLVRPLHRLTQVLNYKGT